MGARPTRMKGCHLRKDAGLKPKTQRKKSGNLSGPGSKHLRHELGIHQVKLQAQNEEQQSSLEELECTRANYTDLYEFAPVGYLTFDAEGIILDANRQTTNLLSTKKSLLIKKPFSLFIAESGDKDIFYILLRESFRKQTLQTCEIRLLRRNEVPFYGRLEAVPVQDAQGNVVSCRAALSDITTRRNAEDELNKCREQLKKLVRERTEDLRELNKPIRKEIEMRNRMEQERLTARIEAVPEKTLLETVMETLPVGVAILDARGGNVRANRMFKDIWGGPRPLIHTVSDYAAYRAWWLKTGKLVEPEEWASALALRRGEPVVGQLMKIERFDGTSAVVLNSATPIFNEAGEIISVAVVILDISERVEAEKALRESETRYRVVADNAYNWEFWMNPEGRYIYISPSCKVITGRKAEEFLKDPALFTRIVHPGDLGYVQEHLRAEKRDTFPHDIMFRIIREDGDVRWIAHICQPVFDGTGNFLGTRGNNRDITEQRQMEDALLESEERYRDLFEDSPISVWEEDLSGIKVYINRLQGRNVRDLRKYFEAHPEKIAHLVSKVKVLDVNRKSVEIFQAASKEELIRGLPVYLSKAAMKVFADKIISLAEGNLSFSSAVPVGTVQGTEKMMMLSVSVSPKCAETWSRVLVSFIDITDLKMVEEKLIRRTSEFEAIYHSIADAVIFTDIRRSIIMINPAVTKMFGYTADELIGKSAEVLYADKRDYKIMGKCPQHSGSAVEQRSFEIPYRHKNGSVFSAESIASEVKDAGGYVIGYIGIHRDITRRKKAEEALRTSEERFRLIAETSRDIIFQIDLRGEITYCSPAVKDYGYTPDRVMQSHFSNYFPPGELPRAEEAFRRVISGEQIDLFSVQLLKADASPVHIEINATPVMKKGKVVGVQGIARDISIRKQAEEYLLRSKEDLEDRVRERTERLGRTNELLQMFTHTFLKREYLNALIELLTEWCRCECAAIRLVETDGKVPFIATKGFSREFLKEEHCLSLRNDFCACTRIILEKPKAAESHFMTPSGSFVCNDVSLLERGRVRRVAYRGTCVAAGFSSLSIVPIRHRGKVLGAIHLADKKSGKFPLATVEFIESVSPLIGEALYRFSMEEALMGSRQQLRSLSTHLLAAREEERTKIAREIHDELGQTLTAASLELSRIKGKDEHILPVSHFIANASHLIDSAVQDIQRICTDLRPRVLDHLGLKAAIEWQAREFSRVTGISYRLALSDNPKKLPDAVSVTLFRIFQEALTNIARHSGATEIVVSLGKRDVSLVLRIRDNGRGILKQEIVGENAFGVLGMRERAHDLGGTVTIRGIRNKGTTVIVKIPLLTGGSNAYHTYRRRSSDRSAGS
jgi:PAS domain S-box-containing protein